MTLADYWSRNAPEYYPYMHLDGFSPEQILEAKRKEIYKQFAERDRENEIDIRTEIKLK